MFFNKKGSKCSSVLVKITAVFMSAIIFGLLTGAVTDYQTKHITFVTVDAFADSEKTTELTTKQITVSEFLEENDIKPGEFDKLNMLLEDELYDGARLVIRKGRKFTLNIDGNMEIITTTKKTVSEAFEEAGISIGASDRVEPPIDTNVEPDMTVNVFRVLNETITVDSEIPFETVEVPNSSLAKGKTAVKVRGANGLKRTVYSVTTEDGVEIKRQIISETTLRQPTKRVISVGTKAAATKKSGSKKVVTKAGQTLNYSKKFTVSASAYTASAGKKTASGRVAQYGVIAVDPKVIPLGTKLYVESTDDGKSWQYGYCIAGDTGGAIKGNKIDLFFNSRNECLQFGRRSAIVYVLN